MRLRSRCDRPNHVFGLSPEIAAAVHHLDQAFETMPSVGAGSWHRTGLLVQKLTTRRYENVPPEAFPVLDSGCDGCHYALWLDDIASPTEPAIVFVSPMDGVPETIQLVAPDARSFVEMFAGSRGLARATDAALARRRALVRYDTADTLGVVAPAEPFAERPDLAALRTWPPQELHAAVEAWLAADVPGLALAVARDWLVAGTPDHAFGESLARIYRALGRHTHAEIALRTFS